MKIKFYNHFPKNESELQEEKSCWSWVFDILPYVRNVYDAIFGRSISIGWLFWSIKFMFEPSLTEYVNENEKKTKDNGENNENQYRLNKRFNEGEKVYNVWYNPQLGKFLVIDHFYRERYDQYNIMLCASYEEANAFAFCMNKSLLLPIKDRKTTLNHLEELKNQTKQ